MNLTCSLFTYFQLLFISIELRSVARLLVTTNGASTSVEHTLDNEERSTSDGADTSIDPRTIEVEEEILTTLTERQRNLITLVERFRKESVHKLRLDGTVELYKLYCELLYPVIMGKQKWKMNHRAIGIKVLTMVADEALIALLLENNIEEWLDLANGGTIDGTNRKTLYTHGGQDATGTKKGWSLEGRLRYNTLHAEVKKVRNDKDANVTDESLKSLKEFW